MSLADVVRSAVAVAHKTTLSLQASVTLEQWNGQDSTGKSTYGDPVTTFADGTPLTAIVERKHRLIRTIDGRLIAVNTKLTFLNAVAPNGADSRVEPIDARDRLTMQDGTTGPIAAVFGMQDAGFTDGRAFFYEAYLE